jgi:hypothetical protein
MLSGKPLFPGRDCEWMASILGIQFSGGVPAWMTRLFIYLLTSIFINPTPLDHHQLSLILDTLGTPSLDDFYAINSKKSREYIRALPFRKKKNFTQLFPKANPLVSFESFYVWEVCSLAFKRNCRINCLFGLLPQSFY